MRSYTLFIPMKEDIAERKFLLELYETLRVADVRDGMDACMRHWSGSVAPVIRPLWRTRACGIARTVRYLPYNGTVPQTRGNQEYYAWASEYYNTVCPYPWMDTLADGDFVVVDQSSVDAGLMGSENTLNVLKKGGRGILTNGGVRDTDEVVLQQVPVWCAFISQKMVQGRIMYESMDQPVAIGGVTVRTGDVVVADGDGVIVVPREIARDVASYASEEHQRDMKGRRQHYDDLGRQPDDTVWRDGHD